ncbi:3-methyladenine DNA glycosylase [Nocardioides coralli]|uniref:3-methyladenine DNA glycosylase n=1 Tax=Nocardioides coralli TaxID=2872154 RepID=UPI001CA43FB2|nr:3-methyladenine DNA glycosylase [Nocardioides coralli]QZY28197.1 3-methyladenine DNA glycosylase [Nocardioides coralli]
MSVESLTRGAWQARATAHADRLAPYVEPHLARRREGVKHPVHDFLFSYYSQRPAQLMRWHPGFGVALEDAPEYAGLKGYLVSTGSTDDRVGSTDVTVDPAYVAAQRSLVASILRLLVATASRPAHTGCFGLHEWAMVYRADETRHPQPLRLGAAGTDTVVESHRIMCSHFDAFRFFTDEARPRNTVQPGRDDRPAFEQPGCLHAGMDLYKHAFRLTPMVSSDLVADCFELAWDIRELDMRAAPYDLAAFGFEPVRIETVEGKREYAAAQQHFTERGAPLRQRLIDACERLLIEDPVDVGDRVR